MNIPQFQLGFGHHRYYINDEAYVKFTYYSFGRWIQTFSTLMFTKVSICLFLLHIPVTKALRRPLQAAIVILIVSNVALTLMWILQCNPVNAAWNPNVHGKCLSKTTMLHVELTQGGKSSKTEFALVCLQHFSHISHLRFCSCSVPDPHYLQTQYERSHKSGTLPSDGSRRHVLTPARSKDLWLTGRLVQGPAV